MARLFILSVPATHAEGLSVCIDPSRRPGRGCSTSALCILTQIQGGEPQGVPVALLIPLPSPPGDSRTENWVLPGDGWTWITQHVHMVLMCLGVAFPSHSDVLLPPLWSASSSGSAPWILLSDSGDQNKLQAQDTHRVEEHCQTLLVPAPTASCGSIRANSWWNSLGLCTGFTGKHTPRMV